MEFLKISKELFFKDFFEKQFYFEKNGISNVNFNWEKIDEILFSWDINDGLINIFKDGKLDHALYTEDFYDIGILRKRIIKENFNNLMLNGATLVLNRIDIKSLEMNRITKLISHFVKEKVVANGYAAFGGNGTFAKHWDTHDVFAIQIIGRKRWKLFAPTFELPLSHQKSKDKKNECPDKPIFDEVLEAGDILYIPRGFWHEAIPLEDEETFHIAAGIHTLHVTDYLSWYVTNVLSENSEYRKTFGMNSFSLNDHFLALEDHKQIEKFTEGLVSQERNITPFLLSRISNIKSKTPVNNGHYLLNTVYSLKDFESGSIIINGTKLNLDTKTKKIIHTINSGLYSKEFIIDKHAETKSEEEKISRLLDTLVLNDIAYEI